MKISERKALLNALNIPEPARKAEFLSGFAAKIPENKPAVRMNRIFRYSSIAAVMALVIGIAGHFSLSRDFSDKFNNGDIISAPVTTSTAADSPAVTTITSCTAAPVTELHTTVTEVSRQTESAQVTSQGETKISRTTESVRSITTAGRTSAAANVTSAASTLPPPKGESVTTQVESTGTEAGAVADFTITPAVTFVKTENVLRPADFNIESYPGSEQTCETAFDLQHIAESSDLIVMAEITGKIYTCCEDVPFTQENLLITDVFRSDKLTYGAKISVYFAGGYVSAAHYADSHGLRNPFPPDSCVFVDGGNTVHSVGTEYIFFLRNGGSTLPQNAYAPTNGSDVSVFVRYGDRYFSVGEPSLNFTVAQLRDMIAG